MKSESLKNSINILKSIAEEINPNSNPNSLSSSNKLIKISKRLKMANLIFQEECKEQKKFLKKYIKKPNSSVKYKSSIRKEKLQNFVEINQNENAREGQSVSHNLQNKLNDKKENMEEELDLKNPPFKIEYANQLSDEEIKEMIRAEYDILKLKEQYQNSNQSDSFFQNLCYTIHSVSKNICNQAEGIYNKVRQNFQKILQEQDIIAFQKSSQWFKNTINLFQIEQKKYSQLLILLKEEKNNFCLEDVKYDRSFQQQKEQIHVTEKAINNKQAFLYSHSLYDNKIVVQKFPNYSQNSKMGSVYLGYSDIIHFEVLSNHQDPENLKSILILSGSKKLSLNTFKINNLQILPIQKIFNDVLKFQHQDVQNCFAILSKDRKKIQVLDENGRNIYTLYEVSKYLILSFCFFLDNEALHIVNFMNNFTVVYNKIKMNNQGEFLRQNLSIQIIQTDIYLESTKLPSENDSPDMYFLKENHFYLQFSNKMYILYANEVEIGVLLYENINYIKTIFFENCIFRIYTNDITIQYYEKQNVFKEKSIFDEKIENLSLKQALITKISEKEFNFQIDVITIQDIYYTFYFNIEQ